MTSFSWIITAFRARPVPAGHFWAATKVVFMDDTHRATGEVEGLTESTISAWDGGGLEAFMMLVRPETRGVLSAETACKAPAVQ